MSERIELTIERYRTPSGEPTCSASLVDTCPFYFTQRMGTVEMCCFNLVRLERPRDNELGYLIPHKNCPVWLDRIQK
jgi:hypothetical protein